VRGLLLGLAVLLGLGAACDGDGPLGADAGAARVEARATLGGLRGSVMIKRAAGDDWVEAAEKMELFENDKIRTAPGAQAELVFANGSHVQLGEEALIGIAETQVRPGQDRTDLTVLQGQVAAEVDHASQSLSVGTPAATVRAGRELVFQ